MLGLSSLALVLLLAAARLFAAGPDIRSARAPAPALVQEDLVTSEASSVPHTNGWGAHGDRLVRASDGDLYTTYVVAGTDSEHFRWVLAKRSAGGTTWDTVATGAIARAGDPPNVLLGPSGTVFVISISPWDSSAAGAPEVWDSRSDMTTPIPGRWLTGAAMREAGALYPSASIDGRGDIYFWEDVPCPYWSNGNGAATTCRSTNAPGTYYWAYRTARDGRWHQEWWRNDYRQTYNFLLPGALGDLTVVGTRDILQAPKEAPYKCPNESGYCFDQTLLARWTNLDRPASSTIVARAALDAPGYSGDHRAEADDAYVDTAGRTHVLVSVVDASTHGEYEGHQLVIDERGDVSDVAFGAVPFPNLARIVQDASGRFWIYSVGPGSDGHHCEVYIAPATSGDGTQLGPATTIPFQGPWDCSSEDRNFDVSVRSGTARADFIDGVVPTDGGRDWVHYRIALPSADHRQLTITSPPSLPDARADTAYTYKLRASGGRAPYRWSIPAGAAGPPAGMSLASGGTLAGRLPAANAALKIPGSFTIDVQATDATGMITRGTVQLNVICHTC